MTADLIPTPSASKVCKNCGAAVTLTAGGQLIHARTRSAYCARYPGTPDTKAQR